MDGQSQDQPIDEILNAIVQEFDPGYADQVRKDVSVNMRLDRLQESLDYLRVCIKYQTFDLEATRRENVYLRALLNGPVEPNQDEVGPFLG